MKKGCWATLLSFLLLFCLVKPTYGIFNLYDFKGQMSRKPEIFGGVGLLYNGDRAVCTAQAISSRTLITAAHCVSERMTYTGYFLYDLQDDGNTRSIQIESYTVHPDWIAEELKHGNIPVNMAQHDLAIITLVQDLPYDVPIYKLMRFNEQPIGAAFAIAGYGKQGLKEKEDIHDNAKDGKLDKWITSNVIYASAGNKDGVLITQLNSWEGKQCQVDCMDGTQSIAEIYNEGTGLPGDSGAAVFYSQNMDYDYYRKRDESPLTRGDELYIIGIHSFGHGVNNVRRGYQSGFVNISEHIDWIEKMSTGHGFSYEYGGQIANPAEDKHINVGQVEMPTQRISEGWAEWYFKRESRESEKLERERVLAELEHETYTPDETLIIKVKKITLDNPKDMDASWFSEINIFYLLILLGILLFHSKMKK